MFRHVTIDHINYHVLQYEIKHCYCYYDTGRVMRLICVTQHRSLRATFCQLTSLRICVLRFISINTRCTIISRAIRNMSYKCFLFKENNTKVHDNIECITINKRTSHLNILA